MDTEKKFCLPNCGKNHIMNYSGNCIACSDIGSGISIGNGSFTSTTLKNICANGCGTDTCAVYNGTYDNYCSSKNCGTGNLHSAGGNCQTCPTSGTFKTIGNTAQTECEACGNHIYLDGYCIYYNPGTSGVCNNDSPDTTKYPNYTVGVYYRDNTGICRRCDSQTSAYKATAEECASCNGLRRLTSDGQCVHDGCTENITFLTLTGCMQCDTSELKVQVPNSAEAKMTCESCSRRTMTINVNSSETNAYCVSTCKSDEWQDVDGSCHIGAIDTQTNEIGSDDVSQSLCRKSGRFVYQEGFKFYCEQSED